MNHFLEGSENLYLYQSPLVRGDSISYILLLSFFHQTFFLMSRFCNFFGSQVVLTRSNSSQLVPTCPNLCQLAPTCLYLPQITPTCPNLYISLISVYIFVYCDSNKPFTILNSIKCIKKKISIFLASIYLIRGDICSNYNLKFLFTKHGP